MWQRTAKHLATLAIVLHLVAPTAAQAAEKDPLDYTLKQYGLALGIALLGGLVNWVAKVRRGEAQMWNLMALMGELCTSAFAGLIAFWLCEASNVSPLLTACLTGIAGHMGTRAISEFEQFAARRFNPPLAIPPPPVSAPDNSPQQGPQP